MISPTRLGRIQVAEPHSSLRSLHFYKGAKLTTVTHAPLNGVLNQETFASQGIETTEVVSGAPKVTALGNCVFNAGCSALSAVLSEADYLAFMQAASYADVADIEKQAIRLYALTTHLTGQTSTEWPPTDCGSNGVALVQELMAQGLISGQQVASGATNIVSLLQTGGVLQGTPFLNSWETPNATGFVDGNGSHATLEKAIASGVAGGHETYQFGVETLVLTATTKVTPTKTVIPVRNSWSRSWGDTGNFRIHLSTLVALGGQCDFRQLTPLVAA